MLRLGKKAGFLPDPRSKHPRRLCNQNALAKTLKQVGSSLDSGGNRRQSAWERGGHRTVHKAYSCRLTNSTLLALGFSWQSLVPERSKEQGCQLPEAWKLKEPNKDGGCCR